MNLGFFGYPKGQRGDKLLATPTSFSLSAVPVNNGLYLQVYNLNGLLFRGVNRSDSFPITRLVVSSLSLFISSGSTLGTINATAFKLWLVAFDDNGVIRLGVINTVAAPTTQPTIYPLGQQPIASSTAEGGVGTANSAQVFYTSTAVAAKAYTILGYMTWEAGLTTAGLWGAGPTRIQLFGSNVPLPGTPIQAVRTDTGAVATGTTTIPNDDTIPQSTEGDQYLSQAITPSSAAHLLKIEAQASLSSNAAALNLLIMALFQDATANALKAELITYAGASTQNFIHLLHLILAAGTASTTLKIRAGANLAGTTTFNGDTGARRMGGVLNSFLEVQEITT